MSYIQKVKDFNTILESLLAQISPIIGSSYNHYFKKLIKVNAVLPIQQFCQYGLHYKKKIMEKDESYFKNVDNHKDYIDNDKNKLNEILRLKGIIDKVDEESKENVWSIFQALVILAEEYMELKNK